MRQSENDDVSMDPPIIKGAFLRDDPKKDQWSEITRITVHQRNRQIFAQSGFAGSFDAPWSEWSRITDPFIWIVSKERILNPYPVNV